MSLFTISDLHLPLGIDKPMDIFGRAWDNYVERIRQNWENTVTKDDTVVLPGDFSWATYMEESKRDFELLNELPGKKILLKGNHDYWWSTLNKLKNFISESKFENIEFLQNSCFMYDNIAICGTRGWNYIGFGQAKAEDVKIFERELHRLQLSIESATANNPDEIIVFMHYPPVLPDFCDNRFTDILKNYNIKRCVYGHIHGMRQKNAVIGEVDGIEYILASCDYLGFAPKKLTD